MAIDVILALTEELDHYTPCRQDKDFYRMKILVGKIMRNTHNRHSRYQQQQMLEALRFAAKRHKGVYRKNGLTPYILHVLEVACILIDLHVHDFKVLVAAIIHDVVEDTKATLEEVRQKFGTSISRIVDLMTKRENFIRRKFYWRRMRSEKNLHIQWRVIIIKFADRIHNVMTLDSMPEENQKAKIQETINEFPLLYKVLIKTLHKLRHKGIIKKDRYMQLPFHLNNRLVYEMGRYM